MTDHATLKARLLQDPAVAAEYERLAPEFEFAAALIDARKRVKLTQAEIAERMGTTQSAVARLESGKVPVKTDTLARYADVIGMRVQYKLVPKGEREAAAKGHARRIDDAAPRQGR